MSFLSGHPSLELLLLTASGDVRPLLQREYQRLVSSWRARFEPLLSVRDHVTGAQAEAGLLAALPADMFVFSMPGYRYLPSSTDPRRDPTYGFLVARLSAIDFSIANRADAIFVDVDLRFTCLCTHEAAALAEPMLVPASAGRFMQPL